MVRTFDDLLNITRITIHGGRDYKEEVAHAFNFGGGGHGHPICTVEIGDTVRHFKCSSINLERTRKPQHVKDHFYEITDRSVCELDKTFTALRNPHKTSVIDFNHSVYLANDETPPLPVYPDGISEGVRDQTSFEVSELDKVGILNHVLKIESIYGRIKKPTVPESACIREDRRWMDRHPDHTPHPIQVVSASRLELDLDDLDLAHNTAQYLFE